MLQGLQLAVEVEEFANLHQAVGSSVRDVPAQQVFRNWRVRFPRLADAVSYAINSVTVDEAPNE